MKWLGTLNIPFLNARKNHWETLAERARREHSHWLTCAMADPARFWRRIPTRRVDQGGFDALMATNSGRRWTERWWSRTIEQVPDTRNRGRASS